MAVKHTQSEVDRCQVLTVAEEHKNDEAESDNIGDRENLEKVKCIND